MTGQMGSALGKLAGSRSEGACVCVWGGGRGMYFMFVQTCLLC